MATEMTHYTQAEVLAMADRLVPAYMPFDDLSKCAEMLRAYAALLGSEPVAWLLQIGDSDVWSYCSSESDADFYGKQSGLPYKKQPLIPHPAKEATI